MDIYAVGMFFVGLFAGIIVTVFCACAKNSHLSEKVILLTEEADFLKIAANEVIEMRRAGYPQFLSIALDKLEQALSGQAAALKEIKKCH